MSPELRPADAAPGSWVDRLPGVLQPLARLSRWDRPVGVWLLAIPCWAGLAFGRLGVGFGAQDAGLCLLFLCGAAAMRGAGCTYNDIIDRDIDAKVTRTAGRPLPAGQIGLRGAWAWLVVQCLVGLGVLICLPSAARLVALAALPLVAAYPFMKRITWWPQAWLGLTFNWGALVAVAAAAGALDPAAILFYVGLALWTLGYDTIYALQDVEDDALIGVRSTARRFAAATRPAIGAVYGLACAATAAACLAAGGTAGALAVAPFALHLAWQTAHTRPDLGTGALLVFKSNREAGLLLTAGLALVVMLGAH
jgi:4-hydroxybenzoate polyprenyltransferase